MVLAVGGRCRSSGGSWGGEQWFIGQVAGRMVVCCERVGCGEYGDGDGDGMR